MRVSFVILVQVLMTVPAIGQTWQSLGLAGEEIHAIVIDWSNPNVLYAGSSSNFSEGHAGSLFKSTNGGMSWDTLLSGITVVDIDIHPRDPQTLYVTGGSNFLTGAGIGKSTDGGRSWIRADSGLQRAEQAPATFALNPVHPETLYCGTAGPQGGAFFRSTNGGRSWEEPGPATGPGNSVTSLTLDSSNGLKIYAGVYGSGIFLSEDEGFNWVRLGPEGAGIRVVTIGCDGRTMYAGTSGSLLMRKESPGIWQQVLDGLPDVTDIRDICTRCGSTGSEEIFLCSSYQKGGVYHRVNEGLFAQMPGLSDEIYSLVLTAHNMLYAGGSGGVHVLNMGTLSVAQVQPKVQVAQLLSAPNPFRGTTRISFPSSEKGFLRLSIFDVLGRQVRVFELADNIPRGHTLTWDGCNEQGQLLPAGAYFGLLISSAHGSPSSVKMLLLR